MRGRLAGLAARNAELQDSRAVRSVGIVQLDSLVRSCRVDQDGVVCLDGLAHTVLVIRLAWEVGIS